MISLDVEQRQGKSIFAHQLRGSLLALLVAVMAIGSVIYQVANRSLLESVKSSLTYHADFRKERLISLFQQQQIWINNIAQSEGVQLAAEQLFDLYQADADGQKYQHSSEVFRKEYGLLLSTQGVDDLFLITPQSELAFSLRPMPEELGIDVSADGFYGRTVLSDLVDGVLQQKQLMISKYGRIEQVEQATMLMGIPLFSRFPGEEGEIIGVLVRPFSLEWLRNLLASYSGLGETGEVLIAQRRYGDKTEVNFINHFRNHALREPDQQCQQKRMSEPERFPMMHALRKESGSGWVLDNGCTQVFAAWTWIPELQLGMVVKQDREEVLLPLNELQRDIVLAGLVVLLFLVWMVHRQARVLVQPIVELTQVTDQGNFTERKEHSIQEVNELARTLEHRTNRLEQSRQEIELILESMGEGLVVTDKQGSIERANQKLIQLLGRPSGDVIGSAVTTLFEESYEGLEGRRMLLQCSHGNMLPVMVSHTALEDGGEHVGDVLVVHDLRPLIKAEQAEEANRAKDDFLASVSHELRTPLTVIIGNSEMLMESGGHLFNSQQKEMVHSIEIAGRMQLALVNDILDLSKIEVDKFQVNHTAYSLENLLDEVENIFSGLAKNSGLNFEVRRLFKPTHLLMGDSRRVGQILVNLLSNAMKFTRQGSVVLTISIQQQRICFSVQDDGIGIDEKGIQRLFEPFEQADHSISSQFGGTGLGLHISSVLAKVMKGELTVESELGRGSTFKLCIPHEESDQEIEEQLEEVGSGINQRRFSGTVLLAEDTPELRNISRHILETLGLSVTTANNGQEVIERAQQSAYDLILMDMRMPVMDGIEATQLLRNSGYGGPIIAHTADVIQKHLDAFRSAGCDDLLTKPIEQKALWRILRKYLPMEAAEEAPVALTTPASVAIASADFEISDELKQIFYERLSELKEELNNSCLQGEWDQLHGAAHAIKGSGGVYGYPQLSELAKAVCDAADEERFDEIPVLLEPLLQAIDSALSN